MNLRGTEHSSQQLAFASEAAALKRWLLDHAYPCWWTRGADQVRGGFHERLRHDGEATDEPRRARLHPRQIYSYCFARKLGWSGPAQQAVEHGLEFFLARYRRPDGCFRTLVAPDGTSLIEAAVLYDQAFALLGLACAYDLLRDDELRDVAGELLTQLRSGFGNPLAGFEEASPPIQPLLSNSHMHLFEASLAWMDCDEDRRWSALAEGIVELALTRFVDSERGFVREFFDRSWLPVSGVEGRIVEPGHQYEWAWLLLRWSTRAENGPARETALKLIDLAENHGVDRERGVAVNSLLADTTLRDPQARLWPQTERIKAVCLAAQITGQPHYWSIATEAARALSKYLDTPVRGLWYDKMNPDGTFIDEPVPASSLYHIVCAIAEMDRATSYTDAGHSENAISAASGSSLP